MSHLMSFRVPVECCLLSVVCRMCESDRDSCVGAGGAVVVCTDTYIHTLCSVVLQVEPTVFQLPRTCKCGCGGIGGGVCACMSVCIYVYEATCILWLFYSLSNWCRTTLTTNKYRNAYITKTMSDEIDSFHTHRHTLIVARNTVYVHIYIVGI